MSSSSPSTANVLKRVDSLGRPGTPVTIQEVASNFDCEVGRIDTALKRLVSKNLIKMKQIGDHRRVWWRPASRHPVYPPPDVERGPPHREHSRSQVTEDSTPPADQRDQEWLYDLIFNQTVQFTGVLTPDGTLIDANESALQFGGLPRSAVVGRPFWEADWWQLSISTQRRLKNAIQQAAAGEFVQYEVTVQGETRTAPIEFSLRPVTDAEGAVTLLIAEGRDISDLKSHEQQLQRQRDALESELSDVLERISDGVYGLDEECRFQYVNDHAETLLGVDESTVKGCDIGETIELTEAFRTQLRRAVDDQEPVFFEDYYEPLGSWFDNAIYPSETGVSVFFRNITERKWLEQELRTETKHFREALQNSPVVASRLDTELRYTWIGNPGGELLEADFLGKQADELLPPEAAAAVIAPKQRVLETGEGVREEVNLELPRGETVYDLSVEPLFDGSGEISGLTATAVDLTKPRRTEKALHKSEERLRIALQAADIGTWELDLQTEESPIRSPEHDRIFGYAEPVDDWSFEVFLDHVHPEDRATVTSDFEAAFETGLWEFECRIQRVDGVQRWIAAEGEFYTDADSEPVRAVGVVRDITDRKNRQQALKTSEQRYRTLVANFPNGGVALLDTELRHKIVDGQGFQTLGFDVAKLQGKRVQDAFPVSVVDVLEPQYWATLDGEPRSFELEVQGRICSFRTIPLPNATGDSTILSIFHDITAQKAQQERRLATLDGLHETVQDIGHLIIESSTQAEIEEVICDRFDTAEAYTAAWIGQLDSTGATIQPSTSGGDDQVVDCAACSILVEPDAPTIGGPIATAIETGEAQLVHTSPTDPVYVQWSQSTPVEHRLGIVIPISYEARIYGVLVVYTDRDSFDPRERDTLGRLGTIVGHAINSIERKRALIADRVTEVVVQSDALAEPFLEGADDDSMTISTDRVLTLGGTRSLIYYTVDGIDPDRFSEIIEPLTDASSTLRLLEQTGTRSRLELSTEAETVHSVVARHGGRISEAALQDSVFHITVRIPIGTDVRPVLDAARTIYPDLRLVSQTSTTPSTRTPADALARLEEELTDRQRETLEVGYYAGFFEWPRETSGDELAELMGVSPPTVHHHLRHGQQKLLSAFCDNMSTEQL